MDDLTRYQIAEALENLAAQTVWNDDVWKWCYELAGANLDDELVSYVYDDLIHCSGTPLFSFRKIPNRPEFDRYKQEFRDVAAALRAHLSLQEYRQKYE